jgi:hypothetical protein
MFEPPRLLQLEALPNQPRQGRETLLRILCATNHAGRADLCVGILCRQDARRAERVIAAGALASLDGRKLADVLAVRLAGAEPGTFEAAQCASAIGIAAGSSASSLAEEFLEKSKPGSLAAARFEVAWLRSILAGGGAEPAWSRWQRRQQDGPKGTLRELQSALGGLAQPQALQRIAAETQLGESIKGSRVLQLALAGSELPERSAFGLTLLKNNLGNDPPLWLLDGLLYLVSTAPQATALMAIDVAVACAPPTTEELAELRPVTGHDTVARVESIMQGLGRGGNLAELRKRHAAISAELRPLLLRRGGLDEQARAVMRELQGVKRQLDGLERLWRAGWRREFESEVLGTGRGS